MVFKRLEKACKEKQSILCVGLDPREKDANAAFLRCRDLVDATLEFAVAYKPNSAFFEALGPTGVQALEDILAYIHKKEAIGILDSKRADISTTADAYAQATFTNTSADLVTLNPYMGYDAIAPFIEKYPNRGAFVLCKTSNPSARDLQELTLANGNFLYEQVAETAQRWNEVNGNLGLVVGATDPEAMRRIRKKAPGLWILAPGIGAQGGDTKATIAAGRRADIFGGEGLLIPISRGIADAASPYEAARTFRNSFR